MPDTAIHIDHVHKRFRLGTRSSYFRFSEIVQNAGVSVLRTPQRLLTSDKRANVTDASSTTELWALQDIDLTIPQGEVLGIIGRNGAGKSTLLKILSKITRPTQGRVGVCGRVGSLLEVGTGFHPELTGRENIYLNGSILGMTRQEVKAKFDEIVAFAEVERFLDTPVKRYSSGMYIRLAFAVAAHLEPEILLVDEVLAVGDTAFQKKCLGKMSDVSASGRTILFISHNMSSIVGMCTRAMLLEQGRMQDVGEPKRVVESYLNSVAGAGTVREWDTFDDAPGSEKVRLKSVAVTCGADAERIIDVSTPFEIDVEYWNRSSSGDVTVCTHLYNMQGACAFMSVAPPQSLKPGLYRSRVTVPGDLLNNGWYSVRQMLLLDFQIQADVTDAVSFEVHDTDRKIAWYNDWPGVVRPELVWDTTRIE